MFKFVWLCLTYAAMHKFCACFIFMKSQEVSKLCMYPFKSVWQYFKRVCQNEPPPTAAIDRVNLKKRLALFTIFSSNDTKYMSWMISYQLSPKFVNIWWNLLFLGARAPLGPLDVKVKVKVKVKAKKFRNSMILL